MRISMNLPPPPSYYCEICFSILSYFATLSTLVPDGGPHHATEPVLCNQRLSPALCLGTDDNESWDAYLGIVLCFKMQVEENTPWGCFPPAMHASISDTALLVSRRLLNDWFIAILVYSEKCWFSIAPLIQEMGECGFLKWITSLWKSFSTKSEGTRLAKLVLLCSDSPFSALLYYIRQVQLWVCGGYDQLCGGYLCFQLNYCSGEVIVSFRIPVAFAYTLVSISWKRPLLRPGWKFFECLHFEDSFFGLAIFKHYILWQHIYWLHKSCLMTLLHWSQWHLPFWWHVPGFIWSWKCPCVSKYKISKKWF